MRIAHISDIHVRNLTRHEEYQEQFNKLYKSLLNNNIDLIVLAGDLFHQKTNLSPESVTVVTKLLKNLSEISTTFVILGNHDYATSNKTRVDSISPIVNELLNNHNIKYFKNNDTFGYNDIQFYFHSQLDDNKKFEKIYSDRINVAVFHGVVSGAKNDSGFEFSDEKFSKEYFEQFDVSMLGDIHKFQYLNDKKTIAYSSSLIQQDFGESKDNHGYIIWDIKSKSDISSEFIDISNDYGYYILKLDSLELPEISITNKSEVRVDINFPITFEDKIRLIDTIKLKYGVSIVYINNIKLKSNISTENTLDSNLNYYDINVQNSALVKYCTEKKLSKKVLDQLIVLNSDINEKIKIKEYTIRNKQAIIQSIEICNLFSFGEVPQIFDLENKNGLIGISGLNGRGKSSILDSILWVLFGKFFRSSSKGDILNIYTGGKGYGILYFDIDNKKYRIIRTMSRKKSSTVSFEIFKDGDWQIYSEVGDTKKDTDKLIVKFFGTYEDLIFTCISPQDYVSEVVSSKKVKKDVITRFIGLDIFEECYTIANKEKNNVASIIDVLTHDINSVNVVVLKQKLVSILNDLNKNENSLSSITNDLKNIDVEINNLKTSIGSVDITKSIEYYENELKVIDQSINKQLIVLQNIPTVKQKLNDEIERCNKELYYSDSMNKLQAVTLTLESKQTLLNEIESKYYSLLNEEKKKINSLYEDKFLYIKNEIDKINTEINNYNLIFSRRNIELKDLSNKIVFANTMASTVDNSFCKGVGEYSTCKFIVEGLKAKQLIPEYNSKIKDIELLNNVDKEKVEDLNVRLVKFNTELTQSKEELLRQIVDLENKILNDKNNEKKTVDENILLLKASKDSLTEIEKSLSKATSELDKIVSIEQSNSDTLNLLNEKKQRVVSEYEKRKEIDALAIGLNAKILEKNNLITQEMSTNKLIRQLSDDKIRIETTIEQSDKKLEQLTYNQELFEIYKLYLQLYSEDGLVHSLLENTIPIIENEVNNILSYIASFKINIELDSEDKEIYIYKNINNEKILVDFCSGMEKFVISLALRVAYTELNSLCKPDIFLIDEGMGVLDSNNIGNLKSIFDYLKTKFSKVIVISHIEQIKDYYNSYVEVIKENNISTIIN